MNSNKPPRIAEFILSLFMRSEVEKHRLGDFEEIYQNIAEQEGKFAAWKWYWGHAFLSIPGLIYNEIYWSGTMLKNYFVMAFRNLTKHKVPSLINIAGLSITMICCVFIFLYVWNEFNYDTYQKDYNRIYRVGLNYYSGSGYNRKMATNSAQVVPTLRIKYPEVEEAVRVFKEEKSIVQYDKNLFYEPGFIYADNGFIKLFSIQFVKGNPQQALTRPHTIVISQKIAVKYFGEDNPIGKTLYINKKYYEVTGIVQNAPNNSHIKYDFITSTQNYPGIETTTNWTTWNCYSYIKLSSGANIDAFSKKIINMYDEYRTNKSSGSKYVCFLQPITQIHLYSNLINEFEPSGNLRNIYIFIGVGLLILLLGCMNFVNLRTSQSSDRIKEIGIRKVVGANKYQIINQFLGESILISLFALFAALIIVILLLPQLNEFAGTEIHYTQIFILSAFSFFLSLVILTGLAAGFIPSFILSKFSPVKVLRGYSSGKVNRTSLRKALIVFQFVISNLLVIGTVIMFQQLYYMKNKELGIEKKQKLIIPSGPAFTCENYEILKSEFTKNASISSMSVSNDAIGSEFNWYGVEKIGNEAAGSMITLNHASVDCDYMSVYNIKITNGRFFDRNASSDMSQSLIINESAVKALGFKSSQDAIGNKITYDNADNIREIIGVVKDFHYASLHEVIKPLMFDLINPNYGRINYLNMTVDVYNLKETFQFIKDKWSQLNPGKPFTYHFLDEEFNLLYKKDEKMGAVYGAFTIIALAIACFGLIGLISFTARKRIKEISVRKVLGASITQLVFSLSKETGRSVLLANVLTWPLAYIIMNNWLQDFPYRISISIWTMALSGGVILIIALLSISSICIKTALANPVDSLKNE